MEFYKHRRKYFFLFVFILLGVFRGMMWKPQWPGIDFFIKHSLCGTVGFPTSVMASGTRVVLEDLRSLSHNGAQNDALWGRVSAIIPRTIERASVGDRICFQGMLLKVKNFGIDGEFDQERYYLSQNIWAKARISKKDPIQIQKNFKWYPIQSFREKLSLAFERLSFGYLLKALVLGIQDDVPQAIKDDFIRSGLIHVLVISGQNVNYVILFCFSFLFWILSQFEYILLRFNIQKVLIGVSFILLILFYIFSGAAIPILRAVIMSSTLLIALLSSQKKQALFALAWASGFILNFIPSSLGDPSFQLSLTATLGLLLLSEGMKRSFTLGDQDDVSHPPHADMSLGLYDKKKKIWIWVLVPWVTSIFSLPIVAFHFHRVSLISILSNWIMMPVINVMILPLSYGILIMSAFFSIPHEWMETVLGWVFHFWVWAVSVLGHLPGSGISGWVPNRLEIIFYYVMIFAMAWHFFKKKYLKILFLGMGLVIGLWISFQCSLLLQMKNSSLRLSFLSVGQGDSALIEFPHGKIALVDGGGMMGMDVGERLLASYLWKNRRYRIDILISSHSDYDHLDGFLFLIDHFSVGEIWLSEWHANTNTFYEFVRRAEEKNIRCYLKSAKNIENISGIKLHFLNPKNNFLDEKTNNQSLVIKIIHQNFSVLFTGDIEKSVEEKLMFSDIQSTILKVPHHGSKTSSSEEFLKRVQPKLAVMSLGFQNQYHFPHPEISERYDRLQIPRWRTDLQGTLKIESDGKTWLYNP